MCEEREVLKFKVPLFCPSTAGVPAHREELYCKMPNIKLVDETYGGIRRGAQIETHRDNQGRLMSGYAQPVMVIQANYLYHTLQRIAQMEREHGIKEIARGRSTII